MRDFVVRIRRDTAMQFAAPIVAGLSPTSQPLMNWKLRDSRRTGGISTATALRMARRSAARGAGDSKIPGPGTRGRVALRRLIVENSRAEDPDLVVPSERREQYEAAFAQFAYVFPDAFYISERGRFFPDDSEDKGRLLSAGFHNVMGYFRDDTPLMELILDENGKQELDRAVGGVRFHRRLHRPHLGPVFLQPERRGEGQRARIGQRAAVG